jgi:predicted ATPase
MIISHIVLKNWRNFRSVDVDLSDRVFLVGPNASGKSNFLDAFRFLRDLAKDGGGLQKAVRDRGGLSKIRCLYVRRYPDIEIEVHLSENESQAPIWKYSIGLKQKKGGQNEPILSYERVWKEGRQLINRPDSEDEKDSLRLTQTYLEQINANAEFREVSKFLESVLYLHLVPQLLRYPEAFSGSGIQGDPFGRNFLERVIKTPEKTRRSRLKKLKMPYV